MREVRSAKSVIRSTKWVAVLTGRPGRRPYPTKEIQGVVHKLCKGISHPEGAWVPLDGFAVINWGKRRGQPRLPCKKCVAQRDRYELKVPYSVIRPAVEEMVNRVGVQEACRRMEIRQGAIWNYRHNKVKFVQRKTARRIIAALAQARREDVVISKASIQRGALKRGEIPKRPVETDLDSFYNPNHDGRLDADAQRKRNRRKDVKFRSLENKKRRERFKLTRSGG